MQHEKALIFEFDMNFDGQFGDGKIVVDKEAVMASDSSGVLYSFKITEAEKFSLTSNIGCGFIECKRNGEDFILCRMTTSRMKAAGEFIKAVNYLIETGELEEIGEAERSHCPKCGRPYLEGSTTCPHCEKKMAVLMRALSLIGPFKKQFLIGCIILALSNLLYAVVPVINRILIDDILGSATSTVASVIFVCGLMLIIRALCEVCSIVSSRMINKVASSYANRLRHMTYSKIQQLSMASMGRKTTGDLLKRITQDTQRVREFLIDQGKFMIEMVVQFIAITIIIFISNPFLASLIILPAPIVLWLTTVVWNKVMYRYDKQWRLNSKSNSILHDIIRGIRVVKAFGNEEREIKKFDRSCYELAEISSENERIYAIMFPMFGFIAGIGEFLVLYFGGKMVLGRELTLGELVQFTMYISYIYGPIRWLTGLPRWLADVMTSLLKIFEILDEDPDIKDTNEPVDIDVKGDIEFKNVTFGYKSYEPVLKNISIDIKQGEMIGLVGHSGTGKSTLINLVMRLYDVNSGALLIDGVDIRNISQKTLHESIGVVFQENFLFAGTIYDNIAYAKPESTREEIISAAKVANAHEFIIKLPDSYNTIVGENGYTLSGGERQRISIARAILRDPKILILDEATSTLDVETEAKIQEALGRLVKNRTTIAIAHRLSTLRGADRLVVLEKGRLAECGTHKELLDKKGIYYNLVMAQLQTQKLKN